MGRKEKSKVVYQQQSLPGGGQLVLKPLVLEHFGRWGEESTVPDICNPSDPFPVIQLVNTTPANLWAIGEKDSASSYSAVTPGSSSAKRHHCAGKKGHREHVIDYVVSSVN